MAGASSSTSLIEESFRVLLRQHLSLFLCMADNWACHMLKCSARAKSTIRHAGWRSGMAFAVADESRRFGLRPRKSSRIGEALCLFFSFCMSAQKIRFRIPHSLRSNVSNQLPAFAQTCFDPARLDFLSILDSCYYVYVIIS